MPCTGSWTFMPLRGDGGYTLIDTDEAWRFEERQYRNNGVGYAQGVRHENGKRQLSYLHREIMGLKKGDKLEVDHMNHDTLDNRKANLRVVTHAENHQNRKEGYGRSKYRGVSYNRERENWDAEARVKGQRIRLSGFATEEDAHQAIVAVRRQLMPFAKENHGD